MQPLVAAVAAGVAFTADPTNGSRSYFLVNAGWGLGTSLVDGRLQPDQYRIPKATHDERAVRTVLGEKAMRDMLGPDGLVSEPTPPTNRSRCIRENYAARFVSFNSTPPGNRWWS